ncbi:FAD-binding protein [Lentzea nigeriaca]|uniref:FAD-binding protein n=1 Tax=Lentzea nigeriaca TaxID=1128665 RepID=UPI0027DDFD55|nr:FAD-binding protein [Lentzea nigeriaca]MBM7856358.1 aclacinomycin oxidase [Lentzea nigeriaca]
MAEVTRRFLLGGAMAGGAALFAPPASASSFGPISVRPDDIRYPDLVRGDNHRFVGTPDVVRLVGSTDQVVRAVSEAMRAGKRIAVRSGGHCFEDFVANPSVRVVIDMSPMNGVYYDTSRGAFAVEAGATLGEVYETLFKGWGVTLPAGAWPTVGAGGHILGGGYGMLSRRHGCVVDHLYGVEVVVVDASGTARTVVATREPDDPNRDLWWAHTGGGGGNFGIVTRYWLGPELPRPPATLLYSSLVWPWSGLNEAAFSRLLHNFGTWYERNSAPGSPYTGLFSGMGVPHRSSSGGVVVGTHFDAATPDAARLLADYHAALGDGVPLQPFVTGPTPMPWLYAASWRGGGDGDLIARRFKFKAAYLRKGLSDGQIATAYRYLTTPDYHNPNALFVMIGYGGQVNTVAPSATAVAQRDSAIKSAYQVYWADPAEDDRHLTWIRTFYRDMYASTGGVPVPDDTTDGSYINYPDADLADLRWNTSGVPWHTLYYKDNYPRLQRVKARWDPRNVFQHTLSIRA